MGKSESFLQYSNSFVSGKPTLESISITIKSQSSLKVVVLKAKKRQQMKENGLQSTQRITFISLF
jgi:hypothetical protein